MYSVTNLKVWTLRGFPIRTSAGRSLFAAYRSLSQLTTSFIAFYLPSHSLYTLCSLIIRKLHRNCITLYFIIVKELLQINMVYLDKYARNLIVHSFHCLAWFYLKNGAEEDWTPDFLLAKQALSQTELRPLEKMGPRGIEPLTSSLSGTRSNQLSYGPVISVKPVA